MRIAMILGIAAMAGAVGCATTQPGAERSERDFSSFVQRTVPSVRTGVAQVVGSPFKPELPLGDRSAARVMLDSGHFVICWTRGNVVEGRRALAQAFNPDGSPEGAPTVISPANVDVAGRISALTTDGWHVVATFGAASEGRFELLSVPMEAVSSGEDADRTAAR